MAKFRRLYIYYLEVVKNGDIETAVSQLFRWLLSIYRFFYCRWCYDSDIFILFL